MVRWILCGKNTAATECLEFLVERGDDVWAIGVAGDDGRDGWQRSLRGRAQQLGVRFEQPRRINAPDVVARLAAYRADALLSIQYDQILRNVLFDAIGCPCLNLHFALLPRHRGVAPIAWAVVAGDTEAGVTLHHMTEDIDAGDVIAQRVVPIAPDDTARDLYDKVSQATTALFRESYPFRPALLARRMSQNARVAVYHRSGTFDFSARRIDWTRPAAELHRWIRALVFPPLQYPETTFAGQRWAVGRLAGALWGPVSEPPGTVVAQTPEGLVIAAGDRGLVVREWVGPDDAGVPSAGVGDRFV
jgi:methionyl-tRNA formyltransferase